MTRRSSTNSLLDGPELDHFAAFCGRLRVEDGSALVLHAYQRRFLEDYFAGTLETAVLIPKKNGKSTLVAALALYHLMVTPDADCIIVASTREQAEIVLRQAKLLLRRFPALADRVRVVQRAIYARWDEGRIRILAAEADSADGAIVTLGIVDELHRQKSMDLYGVIRDGLGPRNGRMITISTAGYTQASPLGELRRKAHAIEGFHREGTYNYARSPDGTFAFHEWCLGPGDDVHDMETVKLVNPAPWQTVEALRRRHDSPSMTPWAWLRFGCGIWTEGEEPWIEPEMWDGLGAPALDIADGSEVFLGVDLGVRHDSTGIVAVSRQSGRLLAKANILSPPAGGKVAYDAVADAIRAACRRWQVRAVAYDPWGMEALAQTLNDEGLPMVEHSQSPERMSMASANLYRLIESGELMHDADPEFRRHVLAGIVKETSRGWRLDRDPKRPPIDALIALAMAAHLESSAHPVVEPWVVWGA